MFFERHGGGERALLVHLEGQNPEAREDPQEFQELALSAGAEIVLLSTVTRHQPSAKFLIGSGKVEELRDLVSAEHVDLAVDQCPYGDLPRGEAFDPDRQTGRLTNQYCVIRRVAFVVLSAGRHVEGRIVWRGSPQNQLIASVQPRHLRWIEQGLHRRFGRATEQGEILRGG